MEEESVEVILVDDEEEETSRPGWISADRQKDGYRIWPNRVIAGTDYLAIFGDLGHTKAYYFSSLL